MNWDWLKDGRLLLALGGLLGIAGTSALNWEGWAKTARKVFIGICCILGIGPLFEPAVRILVKLAGADAGYAPMLTGFLVGINGVFVFELAIRVSGILFNGVAKSWLDKLFPGTGSTTKKETGDDQTGS